MGAMLGDKEIERRMGYHPVKDSTKPMFEANRADVIALAKEWDLQLPESREKSLALTALQEALMWANAAVACNL